MSFVSTLRPRAPAAPAQPPEVRLEPMTIGLIDTVVDVEQQAYAHPWTRGNFIDSMATGYHMQCLMADTHLLGYFVAMQGVDEVHLLNITVAPRYQRQGWARLLLEALALWARGRAAHWLWLEVRASNLRAQNIYHAHGYRRVGERKRYYPADHGEREDAVVMCLNLERPAAPADATAATDATATPSPTPPTSTTPSPRHEP